MSTGFSSVLLLTVLLAIGLVFFLRAASKDRTTIVDVHSSLPPIELLNALSHWLEARGWQSDGGDADRQVLRFQGSVASSVTLAILLTIFGPWLCLFGIGNRSDISCGWLVAFITGITGRTCCRDDISRKSCSNGIFRASID